VRKYENLACRLFPLFLQLLTIFSFSRIAPPVFTDNTRQDYQLSAERTKIARSKHKSSRLFIFKMCLVMAVRRMKWNLTQQVAYTALEKEPTRVSNEHHASITPVSREQMSPTRQCKQLKLSMRKEICRMFEFSAALSD